MTKAREDGISIRIAPQDRILSSFRGLLIYVANTLLIGGAVMISVWPDIASSPLVFCGFFVGHIALSVHSIRLRDRALLFLNTTMAVLDLYAVGIRI